MALLNTVQEAFAGVSFGSGIRPVVAKDQSQLVTMYDDFIFDFADANCFASGTRPAVGASVPAAGFVNLAPDAALALSRTASGAVTAVPSDTSKLPVVTAKGISFLAGTSEGLQIIKGGVASNRVMEPTLEGFTQHLLVVYFKETAYATGGGLITAGQAGGAAQFSGLYNLNSGGLIVTRPYQQGGWLSPSLNSWYQAAILTTYDNAAGTVAYRLYVNGVMVLAVAATATSNFQGSNNSFAKALIGSMVGGGALTGEIARIRRVLNVGGALAAADMDAIVAADYGYKMPILLAA